MGSDHRKSDFELARALQSDEFTDDQVARRRRRTRSPDSDPLDNTQNIVHPEWESRDPTPNIHSLFRKFDNKFFQGRLSCVSLEWSSRMFQCAGICYYQRNRMGTSITIRLSEPLLKLRQRKDLVETLLHEMIHAYLFVLNIREPNGGHGPNFKRIMASINKTAGTNITVYHTFHDEVNVYKTHVWKCNGICQHRAPFYGVVKRTCNRAPGPNDMWWAQHKASCGGYFAKMSEPDKKAKKTAKPARKAVRVKGLDDANNVPKQRIDDPKWGMTRPATAVASSTEVQRPPADAAAGPASFGGGPAAGRGGAIQRNVVGIRDRTGDGADSANDEGNGRRNTAAGSGGRRDPSGGNLRNVVGFKDVNGGAASGGTPAVRAFTEDSAGYTLGRGDGGGAGSGGSEIRWRGSQKPPVIDLVRSIWSRKYIQDVPVPKPKQLMPAPAVPEASHRHYRSTPSTSNWQPVAGSRHLRDDENDSSDDDVFVNDVDNEVIELNSNSDDSVAEPEATEDEEDMFREPKYVPVSLTQDERQRAIRAEIIRERIADSDDEDAVNDENIIFIDDEFDDTIVETADAAIRSLAADDTDLDTTAIDDVFDNLLANFDEINDALVTTQRNQSEEIIECVICGERMERAVWSEHLNGCGGVKEVVKAPGTKRSSVKPTAAVAKRPRLDLVTPGRGSELATASRTAKEAQDAAPVAPEPEAEAAATASCPSCWRQIPVARINQHLDDCLI